MRYFSRYHNHFKFRWYKPSLQRRHILKERFFSEKQSLMQDILDRYNTDRHFDPIVRVYTNKRIPVIWKCKLYRHLYENK